MVKALVLVLNGGDDGGVGDEWEWRVLVVKVEEVGVSGVSGVWK